VIESSWTTQLSKIQPVGKTDTLLVTNHRVWQCASLCDALYRHFSVLHMCHCYYCDDAYTHTRRSNGLGNACKREFFEHHRTALIYSGFTAQQLCMVTLDSSLKLALWQYPTSTNTSTNTSSESDSATTYAWYAPAAQAALDLTYHTYVPIAVSVDLNTIRTLLQHC
jgi:hypothetical protein